MTTVGNWRQPWREIELDGERYSWSKHHEFLKFIDLPSHTAQSFELALSSYEPEDKEMLEGKGWKVRHALDFSTDTDAYRDYIANSRGEFTVAKDQNVRLRTGWFSDRSITYLAAGRPVISQDTGFSNIFPTGEGLFGFSSMDEILAAVEAINSDYARHSRAAEEIAREYFAHDVVLGRLLARRRRGPLQRQRLRRQAPRHRPVPARARPGAGVAPANPARTRDRGPPGGAPGAGAQDPAVARMHAREHRHDLARQPALHAHVHRERPGVHGVPRPTS